MRKIAGLNPLNINKRFAIIIAVIFAIFIIIGLFAGCGTDNPVNNGNGNPPPVSGDSLLWSIDSFTVYSNSFGNTIRTFRYTDTTAETRKYKIVAEGISDVPVSNDTAFIDYASYGYPGGPLLQLWSRNDETNNYHLNYIYTVSDSAHNYQEIRHYFDVGFGVTYPSLPRYYITIKKFHIYLVR